MQSKPPAFRKNESAMTIVEIAIAVAVLALVAATALTAITTLNRNAFISRVMANAREVVQSNIETAAGTSFTSTTSPMPSMFVVGTSTTPNVVIFTDRNGDAASTITGTLTRTTTAESNSLGADVRRIKYSLTYTLFNRTLNYNMTTLKASDS